MTTTAASAPAVRATTTTPRAVDYFADGLRLAIGNAELLLKNIPADRFAHMPHPTMNHPAFCFGHLSLYPNRVFALTGLPHLVVEKAGYLELFKAGVQCVEQDGRYPAMNEIVTYYFERHRAVEQVIRTVGDDVLRKDNPAEGRFREMFPTIGGAVNFLLNGHHMLHLGQVSAWRRAMGLPSAM